MKIKRIIIEIRPLKESLKEFAETFGKVKRKEKITHKYGIGFSNIASFRKFFSKRRIELLHIVKHRKPKSIYQLAKLVDRRYKNVYDDVKLLEKLDLITRKNHRVGVDFNKLSVELEV